MRGWPIARAGVVLLLLLLAGLPLRSLTQPKNRTIAAQSSPKRGEENVTLEVTFTQPPEAFSLLYLGEKVLAAENSVAFDFSKTIQTNFPPEGIDLVFEAKWTANFTKMGASIQVTRADGSKQTQNVWGTKEIFEVLTFPGKTGS